MEQMNNNKSSVASARIIVRFMKKVMQRKADSQNVFGREPTTQSGPKGLCMGEKITWIPVCTSCNMDDVDCRCGQYEEYHGPCLYCGQETYGADEAVYGYCSRDCMKDWI